MKLLCLLFILSFNASAIGFKNYQKENCSEKSNLDQVLTCADYHKLNQLTQTKPFQNIAVIGASVSDNYGGVVGPGDKISNEFESPLFKHAIPHKSSDYILADETKYKTKLENSDLIIAVDLFFWNSVERFWPEGKCTDELVAKQVKSLSKLEGKLVLAEVPILRGSQNTGCVKKINKAINQNCKKEFNCLVLKKDEMLPENRSSEDLFQNDGLHLSDKGAQYMSDKICEHLYLSNN